MISSVAAGILATGIVTGGEKSKEYAYKKIRSQQYSPEVGPVLTEFNKVLEKKIRNHEDREVQSVALLWDEIGAELQETNTVFESEEKAVQNIVKVISKHENTLSEGLKEKLEDAILEVYHEAVTEFKQELSKESNIAESLSAEINIEMFQAISDLESRLEQLSSLPQRYILKDSENIGVFLESTLPVSTETEFVNRPELEGHPKSNRVILVGPAGSGKTRLLRQLVRKYANNVTHLLYPDDTLTYPQSEYAIERQQFNGDVLLVWDDVHRINVDQENEVFESYIKAVQKGVTNQNQELYILTAARSGDLSDLPGKGIKSVDDIRKWTDGFWGTFEPLVITELSKEKLRTLATRMADSHGIKLDESVKESLVKKATHTSAPNYFDTVFDTLEEGEEITNEHISRLPKTTAGIWKKQYAKLSDTKNGEELLEILRAFRVLYDLNVSYYSFLVWGIYRNVLGSGDRGKSRFLNAVEGLKKRHWLRSSTADQAHGTHQIYHLHDTQVEAVTRSLSDYNGEFSTFLMKEIRQHLPNEPGNIESKLNAIFAGWASDNENSNLAEIHYRRALNQTSPSNDPIESKYDAFHYSYASFLQNEGRSEAAEVHYQRVLDETSPSENNPRPQTRMNLGNLYNKEGQLNKAKKQYKHLLEETTPTDDLFDSPRIKAHVNYALILEDEDNKKEAEVHYQHALDESELLENQSQLPRLKAYLNYSSFLREEGRIKDAEKQLRSGLEENSPTKKIIDADMSSLHYEYGELLEDTGRARDAIAHIQRGLEVDSPTDKPLDAEFPEVHFAYASLLSREERNSDAKQHYRRGLEIQSPSENLLDAKSPHAHYMYALLLQKEGRIEDAEVHYRRVIDVTASTDESPRPQAQMNLAKLLEDNERKKEAKTCYQKMLEETSPEEELFDAPREKAFVNYGILLAKEGNTENAKKQYSRVLEETSPKEQLHGSPRIRAFRAFANLLQQEGEVDEAEKKYRQGLKETSPTDNPIDSKDVELHSGYAKLLEQKNKEKQAKQHREVIQKHMVKN